jgi:hypothetical protein
MDFVHTVQAHFNDNHAAFFNWSGDNSDQARRDAAYQLAKMIREYHHKCPSEPIRVVAHSHGGNVALLTTQLAGGHIDQLVTLGTPIEEGYRPGPGLGSWDNVYSTGDGVQVLPYGAGRTDPDPATNNIELNNFGHSDLHTVQAWNAAYPAK